MPGSSSEHVHDDGCYRPELTCGVDEHVHGVTCYDDKLNFNCTRVTHKHSKSTCYGNTLTCGR